MRIGSITALSNFFLASIDWEEKKLIEGIVQIWLKKSKKAGMLLDFGEEKISEAN